jgi:hypothetical protein
MIKTLMDHLEKAVITRLGDHIADAIASKKPS